MSKKKMNLAQIRSQIKELQAQAEAMAKAEQVAIGEAVMAATGVSSLADFRKDFKIERRP